jgi:hypothetical protein
MAESKDADHISEEVLDEQNKSSVYPILPITVAARSKA